MFRKLNQAGMTLIEIMVVIAILGIIATVFAVNVMGRFEKAKIDATKTQIKSFEQALDMFRLDNGYYPTTEQGLKALVEKPTIGRQVKYFPSTGYLKQSTVPNDPFGCEFTYYSPGMSGNQYEIISLGDDCMEGGVDAAADIKSYETE
ncbi:type II secretion system major pseudopilin GspG [bacterium]|nr:type II secretion system major pseudopilin GspG [bacterium]